MESTHMLNIESSDESTARSAGKERHVAEFSLESDNQCILLNLEEGVATMSASSWLVLKSEVKRYKV